MAMEPIVVDKSRRDKVLNFINNWKVRHILFCTYFKVKMLASSEYSLESDYWVERGGRDSGVKSSGQGFIGL